MDTKEQIEKMIWEMIDDQWSDLLPVLQEKLPTHLEQMFDNQGHVVDCGRPMIESIICEKTARSHRLFFYLAAAKIIEVPEAIARTEEREDGTREIYIDAYAAISVGIGGKHERVSGQDGGEIQDQ